MGGEAWGLSTGGRIAMIHQGEDRWVLSLPSLPCSGSKSGIHVSRGFVLGGVMGASLRRRPGQPGCWVPGEEGEPGTHPGPSVLLPTGFVSWAGRPPDLSPFPHSPSFNFYLFYIITTWIFLSLYFLTHPFSLSLKSGLYPVPVSAAWKTQQLLKYPQTRGLTTTAPSIQP